MKICNVCHIKKDESEFSKDKSRKDGLFKRCKKCASEVNKKYWNKNKEIIIEKRLSYTDKINEYHKEYYKNNKDDKIKKYKEENKDYISKKFKEYYKEWYPENKHKKNIYIKNKLKTDINFKIKNSLSSRMYQTVKKNNYSRTQKTIDFLGCTVEFFKHHLESKFVDGMNWENYGRNGWHMDHIKPCSLFNLSDIEEQKKCFHYTNIQPLWEADNIRKSNKYNIGDYYHENKTIKPNNKRFKDCRDYKINN